MDNIVELFTQEVEEVLGLAFELVEVLENADLDKIKDYQPELRRYGCVPDFTKGLEVTRSDSIQVIQEHRMQLINDWFVSPKFTGFENAIESGVRKHVNDKIDLASSLERIRLFELKELARSLSEELASKQVGYLFDSVIPQSKKTTE